MCQSSLTDDLRPHSIAFLQIAGEPLDQTVFQYGPFVMTSREEVQKTLQDCEFLINAIERQFNDDTMQDQMGTNGFEKAHTWKSEIGGL